MKTKKHDTRWMVSVALMAAIVIVLANTPLGMIQLPIIKATTVHIPVILGAILLGPGAGAILGAVFGICSLVSNTMAPTLLSFAFSPFLSTTGIPGALKAIWISVGCRILIGVAAGWLWVLFTKIKLNQFIALPIVGFVGSMVNTVTVMGSIYFLFAQQYAEAKEVALTAVFGLVMGTVTASGIPEAIAAAILVLALGKVLVVVFRKMNLGAVNVESAKYKLMGPMGIGCLYGKRELLEKMPPFLTGGEMIDSVTRDGAVYAELPHKFEAGTVNAGGAVALAAAIDYLESVGLENVHAQEQALTRYAYEGMKKIPGVNILGSDDPDKHCGILSFTVDGVHPHDIATILDSCHVDVRAGHHCAQPLLAYLGVRSWARASLAFYNTTADIDRFLAALGGVRKEMGYAE